MYSRAQEMAARMVGTDWPGVLHYDLLDTVKRTELRCEIGGQELGADALAVVIMAWELAHPGWRTVCE